MNITLENKDALNAVVKVDIAKEDYSDIVEKVLNNYRKTANIPGFRKGKVPKGLVKKQYGQSVLVDEVNKLLQESLNNYLTEEKLDILGNPLPKPQDNFNWEDDDYSFEFELGLAPEFEVNLDNKKPITHYVITADDEMVDNQIKMIQKQYGKIVAQDEVKEGYTIEGTFHNPEEEIEQNASFTVDEIEGKNNKKKLIGAKTGEQVTLKSSKLFKDAATLASKLGIEEDKAKDLKVDLTLAINEVNEHVPAELNQELFDKYFGEGEVNSEEELKERIKADSEKTFAQQGDQQLLNDVTEYLVENTSFDLPAEFLQKWLKVQGEKELTDEEAKEEYEKSEKGLKYQLIEGKIINQNDLQVQAEDLKAMTKERIKMQMAQFGQTDLPEEQLDDIANRVLSNQDEAKKIAEQAMSQKLLDFYKEKLNLKEEKLSYKAFIDKVYK
ncbi:trigger factor [Psychroflexus sp. ALD_RP9]|uniref:trigger factor n=1 Tax=Psychroflexus sp. ALD_RP9 TaxID=2777186 RepID=UPI001A903052|nr:trigger factor [Psychroflexus sp. ALD_RP9]QSS96236.1 trigger factor [Psychroflexus sp. ALD_RP9]